MDFLASGNQFFSPFFRYYWRLKLSLALCKFIFATNPLFWVVETDFLASENHFVPISQISFWLEAVFSSCGDIFKRILHYSQWQQIFCLMGMVFLHSCFFWSTIIAIRGRLIFRNTLFLLVKTVFFNFFRHWFKRKESFGPLKSYISMNPSFWLVETVFD